MGQSPEKTVVLLPGDGEGEDGGKLIVLMNSFSCLDPPFCCPPTPLVLDLCWHARPPLGRGVCSGPVSITHSVEHRRRGASGQPAVINCLFGLLLWPGREGHAPSWPGLLNQRAREQGFLLSLPQLSTLNPCPGWEGPGKHGGHICSLGGKSTKLSLVLLPLPSQRAPLTMGISRGPRARLSV